MILQGANILMGGIDGRFDGHAHVFKRSLPMYLHRRYTPDIDAPLTQYLAHLRESDLQGGILSQPSFLGYDNSFLMASLAYGRHVEGVILRGVAVLEPSVTDEELARMTAAGIIGLRLNLLGEEAFQRFDIEESRSLLQRVSDRGWHVELYCEGHRLPRLLPPLLDHCESLVVDHFGLPDIRNPLDCPGQKALLAAPPGRVFVKTSAPYRVFRDLDTTDAVMSCKPVFRRLLNELGPQQLLWGSDWPWTQFEDRYNFATTVEWERTWLDSTLH